MREVTHRRGRWRAWFERASTGLLVVDPAGLVAEANDCALRYFGATRSRLLRQPFATLLSQAATGDDSPDMHPGEPGSLTVGPSGSALFHADFQGTGSRWYLHTASPVAREDGLSDSVVTITDVSACHAATEARLARARRDSEAAAIEDVAATVADEFADILTTILGNVSLARAETGEGDRPGTLLEEAEAACLEAKRVLRDLLTLAHSGAPAQRTVDVEALARDVIAAMPASPGLQVRQETGAAVGLALGDGEQLRYALLGMLLGPASPGPRGRSVVVAASNCTVAAGECPGLEPGRYVSLAVTHLLGRTAVADGGQSGPPQPRAATRSGSRLLVAWAIARGHGGQLLAEAGSDAITYRLYLPATG
ncbi:MAG: nitrogen regulation protein NR(II) [Anaerolineae bacterium]